VSRHSGRSRVLTIAFYFVAWSFAYGIRYALAIVAPALMKAYHIPAKEMGYILSGWTWSYTAGLLFMGPLVDRLGAWIVTAVGSLVWGVSTLVVPLAHSPSSLFLFRLLFGLGHCVLIASSAVAVSQEFSGEERARAIASVYSGNQVGLAAGAMIAALILAKAGWEAVFYWIGGTSVLFAVAWLLFYPNRRVGTGTSGLGTQHGTRGRLRFFRYGSTWAIAFGQMGYLYALGVFVSWLPGYFVLERKMTLLKSGVMSALPFSVGLVATLAGGWLADQLVKMGLSTAQTRKSIIGLGMIAATVFVTIAAFVPQDWLAVVLLTLCVGSLRITTGSVNALPIDLAPRSEVGTLSSIQNFFGNIGALSAPIVTGYLVNVSGSFTLALVTAGGMATFGACAYVFVLGDVGLQFPNTSQGSDASAAVYGRTATKQLGRRASM
jgi:MFS transporter, ACS family, D-galactonate transporter